MLTRIKVEKIKDRAEEEGWNTCPWVSPGRICRKCHKEMIGWGYVSHLWVSPRGVYYHLDCAVKRLEKELRISVA